MQEIDIIPVHIVRRGPLRRNTGGPIRVAADILDTYRSTGIYSRYGFVSVNQSIAGNGLTDETVYRNADSTAKHAAAVSMNATNAGLYLQLLRDRFRLRSRLRGFPFPATVVHSHDQLVSGLIGSSIRIPHVLTIHSKGSVLEDVKLKAHPQIRGTYMERRFRDLECEGVRRADIVTFPSIGAREQFEQDLPGALDGKDVRVVYNGIDWQRFEAVPVRRPHPGLTLLSVCALTEEKRFDRVLRIAAELLRRGVDVRVLHAGSGRLTADVKRMAADLGIARSVVFLGSLPLGAVLELYRIADVFLLAGERVVFDLAALEAMASGLPVVLSDTGGNRELVDDGVDGYLCAGGDTDAFVERIQALASESCKRSELGSAARRRVRERFTLEAMTRNFDELYRGLIARNAGAGK